MRDFLSYPLVEGANSLGASHGVGSIHIEPEPTNSTAIRAEETSYSAVSDLPDSRARLTSGDSLRSMGQNSSTTNVGTFSEAV